MTSPSDKRRSSGWLAGYSAARRDAARIVAEHAASTPLVIEQAIRNMKPSPGANAPKES